jgi:meiotically up-regulated gene 157 (Mug157) protein
MRNNEKLLGLMMALSLLSVKNVYAVPNLHVEKCVNHSTMTASMPAASLVTHRPPVAQRLFRSEVIDRKIAEVKKLLKGNPYLAWLFENCYPNTLDTTVHYAKDSKGDDDTFVYTGDIHAMWLRDSGAQIWPYVQFANKDPKLKSLIRGVINRQMKCINIDPYANAFNAGPTGSEWDSDETDMKPELHERKYEIDSLCYPIRLAYYYWQVTGDTSVFGPEWLSAIQKILTTFREQQRKSGLGSYHFMRKTDRALDTVQNDGYGAPVKPVGLIASVFRPSDDATTFLFLVPSNFMAVSSLRKASAILKTVNGREDLSSQCTSLADEVEAALQKYAVYNHPKYGKIYAYEVDGFGNQLLMDDANAPSLLSMGYLDPSEMKDSIYQNTRRFVWSEDNPYYFHGKAAGGIGGPHIGYDMIWPMSLMMRAFTSTDDVEIRQCIATLERTDAGTGFMHESFNKNDPEKFTRPWFAWSNTLFGELILKLIDEGKVGLLNSANK